MPQLFSSRLRLTFQRRGLVIIQSTARNILLPLLNLSLSFLVTRWGSVELWGAFVEVWIIVQLGVSLVAWGNREYLLREFSHQPAQLAQLWQSSLLSRGSSLVGVWLVGIWIVIGLGAANWTNWAGQQGLQISQTSEVWQTEHIFMLLAWSAGLVLVQACEVLTVYRKDFVFSLLLEAGLWCVQAGAMWLSQDSLTLSRLLLIFSLIATAKAVAYVLRFQPVVLTHYQARFEPAHFSHALPFFLLSVSGMLQSRVDLYCVSYFLPAQALGQYQVFINMMLYWQSLAVFILTPFVKNLYRLPNHSFAKMRKMSLSLGLLGLGLIGPALLMSQGVLSAFYQFDFSTAFILWGGAFVLPTYLYLPIIYGLYKVGRQSFVLMTNAVGIFLNLSLNLALLPRFGLLGALIASAVVQWLMLLAYSVYAKHVAIQKEGSPDHVAPVPKLS